MQLVTENVWNHIYKRAKENSIRYIAVAYLGKDASRYLPLDSGDVLVIDASEQSIKSGTTNPYEIEKYIKKGVEIYSYENLHAKVFVFGNIALIGSANVSSNSAKVLKECMVEITNFTAVSEARGFVRSLALVPLSPEYVKYLKKIYCPAKTKRKETGKPSDKFYETSLWIERIVHKEYTKSEEIAYETGKKKVIINLANKKKYEVGAIVVKKMIDF